MLTILAFFVAAFVSGTLCYLTIATKKHHIQWTGDIGLSGPQKIHIDVIPRVGGVAIILGIMAGSTVFTWGYDLSWAPFIWIFLPCVAAGFIEDVTKKVSPSARYIATLLSAGLFCWYEGIWITNLGIEWLNLLFIIPGFALLFTIFAIGSIAHAFNLIDGQNGLCSGVAIIASVSTGAVAHDVGASNIVWLSGLCAAANIGFLIFNYPYGQIFLGDAGAYFNGAWIGVLLVWLTATQPDVSPWLALSVLIYPVWETLFSMARRIKQGRSISEPDINHLHSLMYQNSSRRKTLLAKSSAPTIWIGYGITCWVAVKLYDNTLLQIGVCAGFILIYGAAYRITKQTRNMQREKGWT